MSKVAQEARRQEVARAIAEQRQRVEGQLRTIQSTVASELGWAPRATLWALPLAAAAAGMALGAALRRRLRGARRR